MTEVSPIRLWVMRALYLLIALGIGLTVWPTIIANGAETPHATSVIFALLGTLALLSLLGVRYPLQMLPILLFELLWKAVWLLAFALPRWLDGTLDEAARSSVFDTSLGLVLLFVIPWRYVYANLVARPADPWAFRRARGSAEAAAEA